MVFASMDIPSLIDSTVTSKLTVVNDRITQF